MWHFGDGASHYDTIWGVLPLKPNGQSVLILPTADGNLPISLA
jgi:hypothetical protein